MCQNKTCRCLSTQSLYSMLIRFKFFVSICNHFKEVSMYHLVALLFSSMESNLGGRTSIGWVPSPLVVISSFEKMVLYCSSTGGCSDAWYYSSAQTKCIVTKNCMEELEYVRIYTIYLIKILIKRMNLWRLWEYQSFRRSGLSNLQLSAMLAFRRCRQRKVVQRMSICSAVLFIRRKRLLIYQLHWIRHLNRACIAYKSNERNTHRNQYAHKVRRKMLFEKLLFLLLLYVFKGVWDDGSTGMQSNLAWKTFGPISATRSNEVHLFHLLGFEVDGGSLWPIQRKVCTQSNLNAYFITFEMI